MFNKTQADNHNLRKNVKKDGFEVSQNSILNVFCYKISTPLELRGDEGPKSSLWNK